MRTLFAFIRKYNFFFLFLILESLALILTVHNNPYQRTRFLKTSNRITGNINTLYASINDYFYLKRENKHLHRENARLRTRLESSLLRTDSTYYDFTDTNYQYIPARVVSNTVHRRNNLFMINKGKKHNVDAGMGVISTNGIAGQVIESSSGFSLVMSLLNKNARFSARIKKNGQMVNVLWEGTNYKKAAIQDIPGHIRLNPGDTIITSGFSFLFPEGINVGTIDVYKQETRKNFNEAIINLSTDFNGLRHVYVLKNLLANEQKELQNSFENEQ